MDFNQGYDAQCLPSVSQGPGSMKAITLQHRLDMAVNQAEQRLAEAKEARDILSRNPDLERLLNIMQKGHF